ncbi:hypothetical protein QMK19_40965 [Streptomyces sp. H10-C2]|uniref:hypothetical protein n=1 Tax=unclassified Streptomyces TaxID=2593676 RepID=UPI0024B9A494|nr:MULTISPECIES: hypothetical protein [unclassified Streptomyces]MDJ0347560.1 hypothetical protein [Streptomyces sp. PH10-H1]MDJ0375771.1 hypothetical protein [Streptomyces sp. H10-C2]
MTVPAPQAVVFDDTALLALGAGHRLASHLIVQAQTDPARHAYVPALCLAAAEASRAGLAEHAGALPAIEVTELDYPAAAAVGALVRTGIDWRTAHAVYLAQPTADWPAGRPVLTTAPQLYAKTGVRTIIL